MYDYIYVIHTCCAGSHIETCACMYVCVCIQLPHLVCVLHTQLQYYYEIFAKKLSADISKTVWQGDVSPCTETEVKALVDHGRYLVCTYMNTCPLRYFLLAPVIILGWGKHYSTSVMAGTKSGSS